MSNTIAMILSIVVILAASSYSLPLQNVTSTSLLTTIPTKIEFSTEKTETSSLPIEQVKITDPLTTEIPSINSSTILSGEDQKTLISSTNIPSISEVSEQSILKPTIETNPISSSTSEMTTSIPFSSSFQVQSESSQKGSSNSIDFFSKSTGLLPDSNTQSPMTFTSTESENVEDENQSSVSGSLHIVKVSFIPIHISPIDEFIADRFQELSQGSTLLLFLLAALLFSACLMASIIAIVKKGRSIKCQSRITEMEAQLDHYYLQY